MMSQKEKKVYSTVAESTPMLLVDGAGDYYESENDDIEFSEIIRT